MPRLPVAPLEIPAALYQVEACDPEIGTRELSIDDAVVAEHEALARMAGHIITRGKDMTIRGRDRHNPLNSDWVAVDVGEELPPDVQVGFRVESPSPSSLIARYWEKRPSMLVAGALYPEADEEGRGVVKVKNSKVIALMGVPVVFGADEETRVAYGVTTDLAPTAELPGALAVDSPRFTEIKNTLVLLKRRHAKKGEPRFEPVGAGEDLLM